MTKGEQSMEILLLLLLLAFNFAISWANASYVGRYWTESKKVGGSFRFCIVAGYIMAMAGFTMVYGYILLLISPFILVLLEVEQETILMFEQLGADLLYLFCAWTIVPTGLCICLRSLKTAWERKTISSGIVAGYNTYAQIRNTINVARNAPSAFSRVAKALFGGKGKKKTETIIVLCAIFVLIIALFGGVFTANAIMKKADREYDMFADLQRGQRQYY